MGTRRQWLCCLSELSKVSAGEARDHLKLVGSIRMNHPTLHSLANAGMGGKGKQPARKATYSCTTNEQPMNASRVGSGECSVQTKRHKIEGAHRSSNISYC